MGDRQQAAQNHRELGILHFPKTLNFNCHKSFAFNQPFFQKKKNKKNLEIGSSEDNFQ